MTSSRARMGFRRKTKGDAHRSGSAPAEQDGLGKASLTPRLARPKWPLSLTRSQRVWGAVAQLGERLVRNEEVSGSIPLGSTKSRRTWLLVDTSGGHYENPAIRA